MGLMDFGGMKDLLESKFGAKLEQATAAMMKLSGHVENLVDAVRENTRELKNGRNGSK